MRVYRYLCLTTAFGVFMGFEHVQGISAGLDNLYNEEKEEEEEDVTVLGMQPVDKHMFIILFSCSSLGAASISFHSCITSLSPSLLSLTHYLLRLLHRRLILYNSWCISVQSSRDVAPCLFTLLLPLPLPRSSAFDLMSIPIVFSVCLPRPKYRFCGSGCRVHHQLCLATHWSQCPLHTAAAE